MIFDNIWDVHTIHTEYARLDVRMYGSISRMYMSIMYVRNVVTNLN